MYICKSLKAKEQFFRDHPETTFVVLIKNERISAHLCVRVTRSKIYGSEVKVKHENNLAMIMRAHMF